MADTTGIFQFMAADSTSSLYRNGKVLMQRDTSGNTAGSEGVQLTPTTLPVVDARTSTLQPTCDQNGFELINAPQDDAIDFLNHHAVLRDYYPQCETLVREATGANVYAFDHNVRSATGLQNKVRIKQGQDVQGPAHVVHGDYTLRSGPERLTQLAAPPSINDTLKDVLQNGATLIQDDELAAARDGRFAIINVWRNIDTHPVQTHPMAFCDSQTVSPEDLVVFEIHYSDRVGENYFSKHAPGHRMYYYPEVQRDEAILIKQWDSAGTLARSDGKAADGTDPDAPCTFSFHSAFEDPNTPDDAPDRWSIEVRSLVIYPAA